MDNIGYSDNYDNPYIYKGEDIIAPTTDVTLELTEAVISNYITEIKVELVDDNITSATANNYWKQLIEERFIVNHYYSGMENRNNYDPAYVDNTERFRLFVDGVELKVNEESYRYTPGRGHDAEGTEYTEGRFGCSIKFEGFDYFAAKKVELQLGDQIIRVK